MNNNRKSNYSEENYIVLNDYRRQELIKEIKELDGKYVNYLHARNYDKMRYIFSLLAAKENILKNG